MKNVPQNELRINLDSILTRAHSERIVISHRAKRCAVLVEIEHFDAEDLRLASPEDFWRMIRQWRASGESSALADVKARPEPTSAKTAGKRF